MRKKRPEPRSRIELMDAPAVEVTGTVTFEGSWVYGVVAAYGGLVAYPVHRVEAVVLLPDEEPGR